MTDHILLCMSEKTYTVETFVETFTQDTPDNPTEVFLYKPTFIIAETISQPPIEAIFTYKAVRECVIDLADSYVKPFLEKHLKDYSSFMNKKDQIENLITTIIVQGQTIAKNENSIRLQNSFVILSWLKVVLEYNAIIAENPDEAKQKEMLRAFKERVLKLKTPW